jgi:hypothetical protein
MARVGEPASRLQPLLGAVAVVESLDDSCGEGLEGFAAAGDVVCQVGRLDGHASGAHC